MARFVTASGAMRFVAALVALMTFTGIQASAIDTRFTDMCVRKVSALANLVSPGAVAVDALQRLLFAAECGSTVGSVCRVLVLTADAPWDMSSNTAVAYFGSTKCRTPCATNALNLPTALAVHPSQAGLFVGDGGGSDRILLARPDGSGLLVANLPSDPVKLLAHPNTTRMTLYVSTSSSGEHRVRAISWPAPGATSFSVAVVAGSGSALTSGLGGPALLAGLSSPHGLAFDDGGSSPSSMASSSGSRNGNGTLFIAAMGSNDVLAVNMSDGTIAVVAALSASLTNPTTLVFDASRRRLMVLDQPSGDAIVWRWQLALASSASIQAVAAAPRVVVSNRLSAAVPLADGDIATRGLLRKPSDIAYDGVGSGGVAYIADNGASATDGAVLAVGERLCPALEVRDFAAARLPGASAAVLANVSLVLAPGSADWQAAVAEALASGTAAPASAAPALPPCLWNSSATTASARAAALVAAGWRLGIRFASVAGEGGRVVVQRVECNRVSVLSDDSLWTPEPSCQLRAQILCDLPPVVDTGLTWRAYATLVRPSDGAIVAELLQSSGPNISVGTAASVWRAVHRGSSSTNLSISVDGAALQRECCGWSRPEAQLQRIPTTASRYRSDSNCRLKL